MGLTDLQISVPPITQNVIEPTVVKKTFTTVELSDLTYCANRPKGGRLAAAFVFMDGSQRAPNVAPIIVEITQLDSVAKSDPRIAQLISLATAIFADVINPPVTTTLPPKPSESAGSVPAVAANSGPTVATDSAPSTTHPPTS